jgi:peptidoglycan/LPS O-acetylase OafA/YrhL
MVDLMKFKLEKALAIVSVLGFITIFASAVFEVDVSGYIDSLLFIILGIALFFVGAAKFFVYFKNGLTPTEINRIVTTIVGVASIITGILIAPFFNIQANVLDGIKAIIAAIAIVVIVLEEVIGD